MLKLLGVAVVLAVLLGGAAYTKPSRGVLHDFGNMSAVTALFVLERMDWRAKRTLMTALGPGFTAVFLSVGDA